VVESIKAPESKPPPELGSDEANDRRIASATPNYSSLSSTALWRYDPRQEPGALAAHAGICAGGAGRPAFLP
jgi:hypothetical protein